MRRALAAAAVLGALACGGPSGGDARDRQLAARATEAAQAGSARPGPDSIVATWSTGQLTRAEVEREGARLPPLLRHQFESRAGRKELAISLVDKRLLADEALRRKLQDDPEIQRQVRELQERLAVQALLAAEEKAAPAPGEPEERAFYESHKGDFATPERVHVRRILLAAPAGPARGAALVRARAILSKARAGESFEALAAQGDGPEKSKGGDLGVLARGDPADPAIEAAAFALQKPGELSAPIESREGVALLQLVEKLPARLPSFEESRAQIREKMLPLRKRQSFDRLRDRLRKDSGVHIDEGALR